MTKPVDPKTTGPVRNALFPVGVDLYPLNDERASFDDWYAHDLTQDLAAMAEAHFSLVRVFVSWKLFEPQVGQYDHDAEDRLGEVLAAVRTHDLKAIVTFFADDRFAEMVYVTWARKRDPRTDDYLIQREISLVQRVVNRYRTDPAIWAWELGNAAFFTGFESEEAFQK